MGFASSKRRLFLLLAAATAVKPATIARFLNTYSKTVSNSVLPCNIRLEYPFFFARGHSCFISSSGPGSFLHQSKRMFLGRVVLAMDASGFVQKSKEEWRAILCPEQFRILGQKGTERI